MNGTTDGEPLPGEVDKPAEPAAATNSPPDPPDEDKIGRQVKREMERRRRLLRIYVALLGVALLLGLLGLIYGAVNPPPDATTIVNLAVNKSENTASNVARAEAEKMSAGQQRNFNALTERVNTQLENMNTAAGGASAAVAELRPQLDRFWNRLDSQQSRLDETAGSQQNINSRIDRLETRPPAPPSPASIATVINSQASNSNSQLVLAFGAALSNAATNPNSEVSNVIGKAADRAVNARAGELLVAKQFFADRPNTRLVPYAELLSRIEELEAKLQKLQGQKCPVCVPADAAGELTYGVKENSTSTIYGLGLEISLGAQRGGKIDTIVVKHPGEGGEVTKTQVAMGETFEFTTKKGTKYLITPVYIQRRRLAKDFIGMAIRKVPAPPSSSPPTTP